MTEKQKEAFRRCGIPYDEWEAIEARTDINPCQQLDEACWSINAIITHEELATYEEYCMEV